VPDPGRVTVRRLNRVEYRNTVRDLTGVEVDTKLNFPVDDSGHGFDNIGDVLTVSPMLLEVSRYRADDHRRHRAHRPHSRGGNRRARPPISDRPQRPRGRRERSGQPGFDALIPSWPGRDWSCRSTRLSWLRPLIGLRTRATTNSVLELRGVERYVENQFDYNQCRLVFKVDGEQVFAREFAREGGKALSFTIDRKLTAGDHELMVEIQPLGEDWPQLRQLRLRLNAVTVRGPLAKEYWVTPKDYGRYFPRAVPADLAARRAYAGEILERFATRAFRRPVDASTVTRLVALAERGFAEPGATFEAGVAQAMVAVLASPRFIFREESVEPLQVGQIHPFVDEYALASRLSYFFRSTMPDEELLRLARAHRLRAELPAQVERMLKDARAEELVRNPSRASGCRPATSPALRSTPTAVFLRDHPPTRGDARGPCYDPADQRDSRRPPHAGGCGGVGRSTPHSWRSSPASARAAVGRARCGKRCRRRRRCTSPMC